MIKIFIILLSLFLLGCNGRRVVRDVKYESGYVGKTYSLKKAVLYIRSLPRNKNVPEVITWNTSTLLADEATLQFDPLIKNSFGTLSPEFLVKPIRNEYVPVGTKFKVVGEYRGYRNRFPLGSSNIHMLLLENSHGEIVETSKLFFENLFLQNWTNWQIYLNPKILKIKRDLYYIEKYGELRVAYCPKGDIFDGSYEEFIRDFALEKELKVTNGDNYCCDGVILNFTTSQSYLTSMYYFSDWGLYGDWYTITGTYLHDNNNEIVTWEYGWMLAGLKYEGYEVYSKMD